MSFPLLAVSLGVWLFYGTDYGDRGFAQLS
jgi:hypothetical protein